MMSENKFKVGDRVRVVATEPIHQNAWIDPDEKGVVVEIDNNRNNPIVRVRMDVPASIAPFVKSQLELIEPTDPRTAFLKELKELLAKYNAKIYSTEFSAYMSADVNGEGVYFLNSELTADNIMDYEE